MAYVLADNILSPLGDTSQTNYEAVKAQQSGVRTHAPGTCGVPDAFAAALLAEPFEQLALRSARQAVDEAGIDPSDGRTVFILSTTKGSVGQWAHPADDGPTLAEEAQRIAGQLAIAAPPFVVCNACVSGLSAIILANRLIDAGLYDRAVVCGCDVPGRFVLTGFQSLKALSADPCRPFDLDRTGLNLGAAAATVVLGATPRRPSAAGADHAPWRLDHGFVRNDAYHISAPSKTGEGLTRALAATLRGVDPAALAFVNLHGTATLFNDQMESVAVGRAGLSDVPACALKGYFGHTLGAAGLVETIVAMRAVDDGTVPATLGYAEPGVSGRVALDSHPRPTGCHAFVKTLSGFGGCNATLLAEQTAGASQVASTVTPRPFAVTHRVTVTPHGVTVDGEPLHLPTADAADSLLTALYKARIADYPKYYKMDGLCRLGFVASELLLRAEGKPRFTGDDNRAVVLFNRTSSAASDRRYLDTLDSPDGCFPSPSVFVYTLPNIVTGEIAIRNGYHGETSFYILPGKDPGQMRQALQATFADGQTTSAITGWVDYEDDNRYEADLAIVEGQ